jgi:hypothetical protein
LVRLYRAFRADRLGKRVCSLSKSATKRPAIIFYNHAIQSPVIPSQYTADCVRRNTCGVRDRDGKKAVPGAVSAEANKSIFKAFSLTKSHETVVRKVTVSGDWLLRDSCLYVSATENALTETGAGQSDRLLCRTSVARGMDD